MVKKQNNENKRISPNAIAIIGSILALIGGFFLSYNYVQQKKVYAYDYMANVFYNDEHSNDNTQDVIEQTEKTEENNEAVEEEKKNKVYNYIGYVEIPKINVNKGFVDVNSEDNNVDRNVYVVSGSTYPNVENGNFILAAHSGTGWNAFFNNLYKVTTGDTVNVKYNNQKYTYKITNIYNQEKTGKVAIYRDHSKSTLTLITCTNNNNHSQTVYIAELVNKENI